MSEVRQFEDFLGRDVRTGSRGELAKGTYRVIFDLIDAGDWNAASELVELTLDEADELHDIYGTWPDDVVDWLKSRSSDGQLAPHMTRLRELLGDHAIDGFESGWSEYVDLTHQAVIACKQRDSSAANLVERARATWQRTHDDAVDYLYGLLDVAVRLHGEESLVDIWDQLMGDWYQSHQNRLDVRVQPWGESARQLEAAIFDGFHAHLTGSERLGDVSVIEETDRVGFQFAPCGSGGRLISESANPDGSRAGPPYDFAVTTGEHDWAWNKKGICAYCVHCCLLNELRPIERMGYPTRVIDPPTWPADGKDPVCTWWVYSDPDKVPDAIYERVGRSRPTKEVR